MEATFLPIPLQPALDLLFLRRAEEGFPARSVELPGEGAEGAKALLEVRGRGLCCEEIFGEGVRRRGGRGKPTGSGRGGASGGGRGGRQGGAGGQGSRHGWDGARSWAAAVWAARRGHARPRRAPFASGPGKDGGRRGCPPRGRGRRRCRRRDSSGCASDRFRALRALPSRSRSGWAVSMGVCEGSRHGVFVPFRSGGPPGMIPGGHVAFEGHAAADDPAQISVAFAGLRREGPSRGEGGDDVLDDLGLAGR